MNDQIFAWLIGLPAAAILGWLAKGIFGPTIDALGAALLNRLSLLMNKKHIIQAYLELKSLIQSDHTKNGHNRFNERKTYLQNQNIISFFAVRSSLMRRSIKNVWIDSSLINSYDESDIFFAGMELFLKEIGKKDLQKIYTKYKDNDQAALWLFLELVELKKPKFLSIEARNYLRGKQKEWRGENEKLSKTNELLQSNNFDMSDRRDAPNSQKSKLIISFSLALCLTIWLYWPLYQKIQLSNAKTNIDDEVSRLDLPIGEEIKEILDRKIDLPKDRYELCLKNNNKFYLIHADSDSSGVPFYFYTNDLNKQDFGRKNNLGAMAINLYYNDNQSNDKIYREVGQSRDCIVLKDDKLRNYASSTIEYRYVSMGKLEELDLGEKGKFTLLRSLVGGYYVDTKDSSTYIIARWKFFLITTGTLWLVLFIILNQISKYGKKFFKRL